MELNYRQIHLDFHTSEHIAPICQDFSPLEFVQTLKEAHVNSITCFGRCHHGYLYYPSKLQPELIHPGLTNKQLLLEQIEACQKEGIKVPIYTTVQWDALVAKKYPNWLAVDGEGNFINTQRVEEPHFYYTICLNSDYRKYFKDHLEDLIEVVGPKKLDGLFLDILFPVPCKCSNCVDKMVRLGFDPELEEERKAYSNEMLKEFQFEISEFIKEKAPQAGIFYNSSHVGPRLKPFLASYTHLELESLPSGGWGYMHFPTTVRYARNLGKQILGMTGKFHTYWGDFHSFKNRTALEYECFQMLAFNAGCSIGDQLDPRGRLSKGTYDLIGSVFEQVKAKEIYCQGAKALVEIAVLTPEEFYLKKKSGGSLPTALVGAVRMLQELSYQFDIIDTSHDFSQYKLLVLPDHVEYSPGFNQKLEEYLANGGKVVGSYHSALDLKDQSISIFGVSYLAESIYYRDFILPNDQIGKELPKEEHVMYLRGSEVKNETGEVILEGIKPYFERAGDKFCSHQHTPSSGELSTPAGVRRGDAIYFAHPLFEIYYKNAPRWVKQIFKDALELLLPTKLLSHTGPSTLITTVNQQTEENRDIIHILNYLPLKRCLDIEVIEDVFPLYNLELNYYVGTKKVKDVSLVPSGTKLKYDYNNGYLNFTLPKVHGHEMIKLDY